ncbi:histidine phosphatase family protein [Marinagarivorans algicola]|uniref:histidine phosphatase family protein n=1 Tax=Marinagarivorans algicola TaxID=1513270 RepID=UPI0006B9E1C8|nr:histidine phosphatase family protein [Marinagarivorans algicola]
MAVKIYAIRHMPVDMSGICYGQSDVLAQAASAQVLCKIHQQLPCGFSLRTSVCTLYSSPLQRCVALAQALFPAQVLISDARLKELNFGDWELQPWDAIERAQLDLWAQEPLAFCMPNGESFAQVIARVERWLASCISDDEREANNPLVAVTHAGVIRALAVICGGASVKQALNLKAPFASVHVFEYASSGKSH